MPAAQTITDLVKIVTSLWSSGAVGVDFGTVYVIGTGSGFGTDRAFVLGGGPDDVRTALTDRGFLTSDSVYRAVDDIAASQTPPVRWVIGKRDAADASWTATMSAVYSANNTGYYVVVADTLSVAETVEVATWCATRVVFFLPDTDDDDVYDQVAGNLAEQLAALTGNVPDGVPRWALGYRNSVTATGAAAPTYTISTPSGLPGGTWDLRPASTAAIGGSCAVSVQSDSGAVEPATLTGVVGTVTVPNAGPFALTDGWVLVWRCDAVATDYTLEVLADFASIRSTVETWDFTGIVGTNAIVVSDTGSFTWSILTTVPPGAVAAVTAAEVVADFLAAVPAATALAAVDATRVYFRSATSGTAAAFRFDAGGTNPAFIALLGLDTAQHVGDGNVPDVDAVTHAQLLTLALAAAGGVGTQDLDGGKLRIRGAVAGTDGSVEIRATSSAGFLAALGLVAGTTAGTGNVPNLGAVTATVLFGVLGAAWTTGISVSANLALGELTFTGTLGAGSEHKLTWTGSRTLLGLPASVSGTGSGDDHAWARAACTRASQDPDVSGIPWWDWTPVAVPGDAIPAATSLALRRELDVNTIENRSPTQTYATLHDGRLCGRYAGKPLYMDVRFAIDWMGEVLALEITRLLESAAETGTSIPLTDEAARPALFGVVRKVMARWAAAAAIAPSYRTLPPGPGQPTGVTIAYKAAISTAQLSLRWWPVEIVVELAGRLQGVYVTFKVAPS